MTFFILTICLYMILKTCNYKHTMFLCCFRPKEVSENLTASDDIRTIYKFRKCLAKGGCSDVWEAKDRRSGKIVAIKKTNNTEDSYYMAREYEVMRLIDSEHVVKPDDFIESGKNSFMVMKKYHTTLFDDILKTPLTSGELKRVAKQIALGLKAIHDAGYVHRDIKPENILLDTYGTCVITDLGLAEKEESMTTREIAGSPSYISPEVAEGYALRDKARLTIGKPVDIYALGLVLYVCLARELPIPPVRTTKEIIRNALRVKLAPFIDELDVSDVLKDFLHRMTDRNPSTRATIDEVLAHKFLT
ncbi:serine/threonine-protein kinase [Acanthocystis turfacea Chlorella virus Br0604L]|nr:serine/threonine-protein kinase [Acanthocystis turfacea Chlorella virus Br0604L]